MKKFLLHPVMLPSMIYVLLIGWIVGGFYIKNGSFNYGVDDPYIHLQMAKNVAFHHFWGMTNEEFSSASSSPLWTLLLAGCMWLFGIHDYLPLLLNVLFTIASMYMVYKLTEDKVTNWILRVLILLMSLVLGNLLIITLTGMEHSMQTFFLLLFFYLVQQDEKKNISNLMWLSLTGFLAVWTRYESAFFIFAVCVYWLFSKKIKPSFLVGIVSLLPVLMMGIYFKTQGGTFLPYTLIIKGNWEGITMYSLVWMVTEYLEKNIGLLIGISFYLLSRRYAKSVTTDIYITIWFIFSLTHMYFLSYNAYFFRYVVLYNLFKLLIFVQLFSALIGQNEWKNVRIKQWMYKISFIVLSVLIIGGLENGMTLSTKIMNEVRTQHVQMEKFVKQYYDKQTVALNDIGLITYKTNIDLVDLWGLGTKEVALAKRDGTYNTDKIRTIVHTHQTNLVVVYKDWYDYFGGLPKEWVKVADWEYTNTEVVDKKVTFYAPTKKEAIKLKEHMNKFVETLPDEVQVKIY